MATHYNEDFHAWTQDQAAKLRRLHATRSNVDLDLDHLAEEIESVGLSERREVLSRMTVLVEHLLKLTYSAATEPRAGWLRTVRVQRRDLARLLEQSPSLAVFARDNFHQCFADGAEDARTAHGDMEDAPIPAAPPFTLAQLLDRDWLPEAEGR